MEKTLENLFKGSVSVMTAAVTAQFGILYYALILFTIVMVLDYATGVFASRKEALENPEDKTKGWSSKKGKLGIYKKVGYASVVAVAVLVDYLVMKVGGEMGIGFPTSTFFGILTTVWFILNECLSIVENAGRMGADTIPKWLTDGIAVLKDTVNKKADE